MGAGRGDGGDIFHGKSPANFFMDDDVDLGSPMTKRTPPNLLDDAKKKGPPLSSQRAKLPCRNSWLKLCGRCFANVRIHGRYLPFIKHDI